MSKLLQTFQQELYRVQIDSLSLEMKADSCDVGGKIPQTFQTLFTPKSCLAMSQAGLWVLRYVLEYLLLTKKEESQNQSLPHQ